jgi:hypothetical protein
VLKSRYNRLVAYHHLKLVKNKPIKQPIAADTTIYNQDTIEKLVAYVTHQKLQGCKDKDIKLALINYGYSKKIIEEVLLK